MLIFLLLCVAIWMLVRKNTVNEWDELRLWAAYPKALYFTERLQLGADAMLYSNMQSYLPGMALFAYWIEKLSGTFHTGRLFWAYGVVPLMLALPATRSLRWKHLWMMFVSLIAMFTLPMYFGNTGHLAAYRSLMIDAMLGVAFGCAVWYASKAKLGDWFDAVRLTLVVLMTALLKDSGAILAMGAAAAAVLFFIFDARANHSIKKILPQLLLIVGVPLAATLLWRGLIASHGVVNHIGLNNETDIVAFVKNYFHTLLKTDIVASPVFAKWGGPELATYATTGVLCTAFAVFGCSLLPAAMKKSQIRVLCTMAVMNAAYVVGLGVLFVRGFSGFLPSYERYISTIAQANMIVILLGFLQMPQEDAERALVRKEWTKLGLAVSVTAIVAVFSFGLYRTRSEEAIAAEVQAEQIARCVAEDGAAADERQDIYLAFPRGEVDILHHQLYYALLDYNIRAINFYDNTTVNHGEGATPEMIDEVRQNFLATVRETGCDYVYFAADIPLAGEQLPEYFSEGTEAGALYRVDGDAVNSRFVRIG